MANAPNYRQVIRNVHNSASSALQVLLVAGTAVLGKVRLVTATGDEITDDTNDAVKVQEKGNIVTYTVSDDTSPAAIALTANPGVAFRLLRVEVHLSAAPTTSENFTTTLDAGDGALFDVLLDSQDLSSGSLTDYIAVFGKGWEFEADDEIDVAYTNTDDGNYGVRIVVEKI